MTDKKPMVSVIIPVYNGEKHIRETIDSVLGQTFKDLELIIIDDASTDRSAEIIGSYGSKVKFVEHKINKGCPAPTKNTGLNIARGEFVAFSDHDDIWLPTKLEKQVKALSSCDAVANFTNGYIFDNRLQKNIAKRWDKMNKLPDQEATIIRLLKENFILSTTSALIRKDILDQVGGFDENMKLADDYEMWLRLSFKGKLSFIEEPLFQWRFHYTSLSHSEEKHLSDLVYMFEKFENEKLTKEQKDILDQSLAKYHLRLGNYFLASAKSDRASSEYQYSLRYNSNQRSLKIIVGLMNLFPALASFIVRRKRNASQKIAKIDPDWTLVNFKEEE